MYKGTIGRAAAAISAALVGVAWGATLVPRIDNGLGALGLMMTLGLAIACAMLCLFSLGRNPERADTSKLRIQEWWPAALAPIVGSFLLIVGWISAGGFPSWAMNGDMVWNTAQSLFVHQDGGVQPELHPNPAPLTNTLFAMGYGQAPVPSLAVVFSTHAVVLLALAFLAALLSGWYVAARASGLHPVIRVALVFAVAWVPYTGTLFGAVAEFGHANVLTSYLVLWLAWIVYAERTIPRMLRVALLLLLVTVTVASWAPLAIVPLALAIVAFVDVFRARAQASDAQMMVRPWHWLVLLLSVLQLLAYGVLVTLPDLNREGAALGQDGGGLAFTPRTAAVILVALALTAIVTWWLSRSHEHSDDIRAVSAGLLAVLLLSLPAIAYLLLQRQGMPSLWGYYPAKFVSMLSLVGVGVMIASIAAVIPRRFGFFKQLLPALVCAVLFTLPVLGPFAWTPEFRSLAPELTVARTEPDANRAAYLRALVSISDEHRGEPSLLFDDNLWGELMVNGYLIQLSTERSTDPVRAFAYAGDHLSSAQLCELSAAWGEREIYVYVGDDSQDRAAQLESCATGSFTVLPMPRS